MSCLLVSGLKAQVLTLDSCLQLAQQNNPTLRQADLNLKRAEQVKMQAFTKYFPQVQGSGFGFHALHPIVEVGIDDVNNTNVRDILNTLYDRFGQDLGLDRSATMFHYGYIFGVTAVQPVFMGGKIIAGNQLAKVGVEAARVQANITRRDALEQVEQTYWLLYGLQRKQAIINDVNLLLDTLNQVVEASVEAGLALPSDLTYVQIRRDAVQRQQLQLNSAQRLARQALALAIGVPLTDSLVLADTLAVEPFTGVGPQTTVTPEESLLALQVRAAELEKVMALADALPQIAVGANYSYCQWQTNLKDSKWWGRDTGNGSVFLTLQVPLTAWWETGHKIKEKQYSLEQARIQQEYLGAQLDLRMQQAYDQVLEAQALLVIQERTAARAQELYDQTLAYYEAGMATITQLMQAQTELTQAQIDYTDAQIAYRMYVKRYEDLGL